MKNTTNKAFLSLCVAMLSGIALTVTLLVFINILANYRVHASESRPLHVVNLMAWPMPVKQQQPTPAPQTKKQQTPQKPASKKNPPLLKTPSPPIIKKEHKEKPTPVMIDPIEKLVEKTITVDKPVLAEATPPMLIEPTENTQPIPVPIFQLTQAPRFLHREVPIYPEAMRTQGISGVVKLEVLIDKDGRVREVNILASAGKLFDAAARQAILASRFYPAEVDKNTVAVLLRLPVTFDLR